MYGNNPATWSPTTMPGSNQPAASNQPMMSGEGIPNVISSFLHGGTQSQTPGQTPGGYLSQISGMLPQYFKPYEQMLDPSTLMSQIGSHYQQSPGYQFALNQALKGVGQASAAGGMAGSPQQQYQAAQESQGMASQDYGNYMQRALGLYTTGAGGYKGLGEDLSSTLMSQSQLAQTQQEEAQRAQEEEQERQSQEKEQRHHDIWSTIGTIGGAVTKFI